MAAKCQQRNCVDKKVLFLVSLISIVVFGSYVVAGEKADASEQSRYRVITLKHISREQAKKYLEDAKVECIASSLPTPDTLLVTADAKEIVKVSSILKVADSEQEYVIKEISAAEERDSLPSNDAIAAEIGQISIGTFIDPPTGTKKPKAIIDVHGESVIAVAPAELSEAIFSAISQLQKAEAQEAAGEPAGEPNEEAEPAEVVTAAEPERIEIEKQIQIEKQEGELELEAAIEEEAAAEEGEVNEPMSDELFDELLESLADLQKPAVEAEEAVAGAEAAEPAAGVEAIEEKIITGIEERKEPNVPAAAKKIVKEEVEKEAEKIVREEKEEEAKQVVKEEEEEREEESEIELEEEVAESEDAETVEEADIADTSYEPEYTPLAEEELELDLPEVLNLIDLLDLVGKYLHLDYMYNVADLKGKRVSLKVQGPIKVKELYPMLESVMKFTGFVMSRKDNFVTIVPATRMMEIDPTLGTVKYGDVVITRVFNLKYVDTTSAQNLLTGMKLGTDVKVVPEMGTLIITDYAYRMERIEELLSMLDKPGKEKTFSFRTLKYTMAPVLAPQIQKLAGQLGTISVTVATPAVAAKPTTRRGRKPPVKKPAPTSAKTKPSEVYLEADERTNRILMIGFEEQLLVINELIDVLDVEQQDLRTMRLYEIQHVDASDVVDKLSALGIIGVSPTSTRSSGRAATAAAKSPKRKTPAPVTTATAGGVGPVEEPQLVIIESTNSLLVNATASQHIQIATIIGYLDREVEKALIPYVVYPLENQDPERLLNVLMELIQETIVTEADKEAKIQKTTTTRKIEEDIAVVADPETYSLIVYASKKNQQWIAAIIKELDAYRPQVLLDVTLVQITKDDAFNFDLNLVSSFPDSVVSPFDANTTISGQFIDLLSDPKEGVGKAFYGDEHIYAILTMMQTKKYGRVMARPKLLVNDNQEGQIKTTTTTYIKRIRQDVVGTESPQTITTESFDDYSAGITLTIRPHISMGDMLRLEITLNRSGFTEALKEDMTKPPNKADADVQTVVTIPDKSTIILGGMEKIDHGKGGKKIPILGDLPLIGGAFRDVSKAGAQDKLYIFVKAHILRPGGDLGLADLKDVSSKNRESFEKLEREMNEYEAWPGIKPQPMDPLRILEEDVR
jgi:type II secretory pathway component GspD/PulD (secretin)